MAFNFNWTPLSTSSTDSSAFYSHAKSLLTAALNKSTKPPIIVDDIFVEELNLGQSAPELEILEIGDLAEDRFRGIFRMSYDGDAFLKLKTKVQANPLNTYLSTTPAYTSPSPLAASSPLTIPLQITLSHFRLSGFIILVFSKAKGITLVFRNDPLESLKVSSTFDSIPFIKDYLQKEIERQVRGLFQEELPVAVHRLSLRLWNPEYAASLGLDTTPNVNPASPTGHQNEDDGIADQKDSPFVNPLISADASDSPSISFSQKNLHRLSALMNGQKTLSLSTPTISDVVFRAWASGGGCSTTAWDKLGVESSGTTSSGPTTYTFSENGDALSTTGSMSSRPGLHSSGSSMSISGIGGRGSTPGRKKKKHRVVNLRKNKSAESSKTSSEAGTPSISVTPSTESVIDETNELELPPSPTKRSGGVRFRDSRVAENSLDEPQTPKLRPTPPPLAVPKDVPISLFTNEPPSPASSISTEDITFPPTSSATSAHRNAAPREYFSEKRSPLRSGATFGSGILERALMMKLASEMQRRLEEERVRRGGAGNMWDVERELRDLGRAEGDAPPAYKVL
ncbi:ERMES complex subunit [Rhizina undulata]